MGAEGRAREKSLLRSAHAIAYDLFLSVLRLIRVFYLFAYAHTCSVRVQPFLSALLLLLIVCAIAHYILRAINIFKAHPTKSR